MGQPSTRLLRPVTKALPEQARSHNRALVLQTLLRGQALRGAGGLSRADVARETGLTRVTVSDLVSGLLESGLVRELGQREGSRPGKPATLLEIDADSRHVLGLDLSDHVTFRGAVLRLDGTLVQETDLALMGRRGEDAVVVVETLVRELLANATSPVLGIGVGTPGVVDPAGTVRSAPNLGWSEEPLQQRLAAQFHSPVAVINDADAAALAEHSFGGGASDMMLVAIGHGVGAGLVLGGMAVHGNRHASGEIGHVTVGTDPGPACACGRDGCLEAWLAVPRLEAMLADATAGRDADSARTAVLETAGRRLGIALAPVAGALDLAEIVLAGPAHLVDGPLLAATRSTLQARTLASVHDHLVVRSSRLGDDIVVRGAAARAISDQLGIS